MPKIFKVIKETDGKYGIYIHQSVVRSGMSKRHYAEELARQLETLAHIKLTDADCPYCKGVGGCYNCDS